MEHLLLFVVDSVVVIDRRFRKRLRSVVPDLEELLQDPAGFLERQSVTIGPWRRYLAATILGIMTGLLLSCGFTFYRLDHPRPQGGPLPWGERVLFLTSLGVSPLLCIAFFSHWLRGGVMILRSAGVVLRYRNVSVFIPWAFWQQVDHCRKLTAMSWLVLGESLPTSAITHSQSGTVIAVGPEINTKPLEFQKDGQLIVREWYAVRLEELFGLLAQIAVSMKPAPPSMRPLEPGDPVPEEMC